VSPANVEQRAYVALERERERERERESTHEFSSMDLFFLRVHCALCWNVERETDFRHASSVIDTAALR